MKILSLETGYQPSSLEREYFEWLQSKFGESAQAVLVDCRFDKYEYIVRRERLAQRFRDKFKLLHGGSESCSKDALEE